MCNSTLRLIINIAFKIRYTKYYVILYFTYSTILYIHRLFSDSHVFLSISIRLTSSCPPPPHLRPMQAPTTLYFQFNHLHRLFQSLSIFHIKM